MRVEFRWCPHLPHSPRFSGAAPLFSSVLPLRRCLWKWRWCRRWHASRRQDRRCRSIVVAVRPRRALLGCSGSKSERPGFPSGLASGRLRSPPVASGRLRSPPVASGRLRSTSLARRVSDGSGVDPGGPWVGLVWSLARSQLESAFFVSNSVYWRVTTLAGACGRAALRSARSTSGVRASAFARRGGRRSGCGFGANAAFHAALHRPRRMRSALAQPLSGLAGPGGLSLQVRSLSCTMSGGRVDGSSQETRSAIGARGDGAADGVFGF